MRTFILLLLCAALSAAAPLPSLERRGEAVQLIVDGKPWLIRGGEIANTASSSLPYMETVWPAMTRLNLNTVLVAVAWAWVEPEEGRFDFTLVDALLDGARRNDQRVVFLWFGSWKNGLSSFAPAWVKQDQKRFPRVRIEGGKAVEILSPFSPQVLDADRRAYVEFVRHLTKVDQERTTLMIQLQNEIGVLGDSRDRSEAANAAFNQPVPDALMRHLAEHRDALSPALASLWKAAGSRTSGTWTQVFGTSSSTDELFMAWQYAQVLEAMASAGKAAYSLPVFTNTWIVQPEDRGPGDYPSGGPQPLSLDVWKAGAPSIDFNAPDIYLPNFPDHVAAFHRADNPLFVPESRGDAVGAANAFYCIGAHNSLGYSPFGIDNTARLLAMRPPPGVSQEVDLEDTPLARSYAVLRDLAPLILEHQSSGTIAAAWLGHERPKQDVDLGNYRLSFELRKDRRSGKPLAESGYALVLQLDENSYHIAANHVQVVFSPLTPGPAIAGIADAERGHVRDGRWQAERKMSGDDILLNYAIAQAAADNQSGSGLMFGSDGPTQQRVVLYRYE